MSKIIIADVLYTITDEMYYVLNREHENATKYQAETLDAVFEKLSADGWTRCGKVSKSDYSLADMLSNSHNNYIAVWEE
jgi:hypothetical protein